MKPIDIQILAVGPGTQPPEEDGAALAYLTMPSAMATYRAPLLPESEALASLTAGRTKLSKILEGLKRYRVGASACVIELADLDDDNRTLVNQALGEGEVSILYSGPQLARLQESVFAGVWRVQSYNELGGLQRDTVEIADIPQLVRAASFAHAQHTFTTDGDVPDGLMNARPVLFELQDKSAKYQPGDAPYVINLTLLPQTEQDLEYLAFKLGRGSVTILSRGYGSCRITATALPYVWWVQHFNSQDTLILNTLEVVDVPAAACAAQEDIEDSAEGLADILEALA